MFLGRKTYVRFFVSPIIIIAFLYSQISWAAGFEMYQDFISSEDIVREFRSPEELLNIDAKKRFLLRQQNEIDKTRKTAFQWSNPFTDINRELSAALYYQKINASRDLAGGKYQADEVADRIAAYGQYYVKHNDGMVTWYYNALLTDIIGEKVKDKIGHETIQDTTGMKYNENRMLLQYNQSIKDERGNVTKKVWDNATYWTKPDSKLDFHKGKNLLSGYHEKTILPTGEVTDKTVSNLTYYTMVDQNADAAHIDEQIASYNQTDVSNQSPSAPTDTYWFDADYLKRPFTYTEWDPFDEDKYPDEDERFDILLTGFQEESVSMSVETKRVWSSPVYNDNEQITSYHESVDSLGFHTERDFYDAEYDEWGRLTSYREIISTEGLITQRYWRDGQYNNIDQITSYKEDVWSSGVWTYNTWDDAVYNPIGQLTSYYTVSDTGGIITETMRMDIIYNEFGLPVSYTEIVNSLGMTTVTERRNITYEEHGWMVGWEDNINERASYVDEANGFVEINRAYLFMRSDTKYYWNGLVESYRETMTDYLGVVTETHRYGIYYNHQGLVISYIEEIAETNANSVIYRTTVRDGITYNVYGQMTGYHEINTDSQSPDLTTEITMSGMGYNNAGLKNEYAETTHIYSKDGAYDTTETVHRYNIVYNSFAKPVKFTEDIVDAFGVNIAKEWWGATYNSVGLLKEYWERTIYPDRDLLTHQFSTTYDGYDRVTGFRRVDTDPFGTETETIRSGAEYDGENIIKYHEDMIRGGHKWMKDWFGAIYNSKNQLVEYKETMVDPFNVTTISWMKEMEYNLFNQLIGYQNDIEKDIEYKETKSWSGAYNGKNLLYSFTEESAKTDGAITLLSETVREYTEYNNLCYVTKYKETASNASTPNKTVEIIWEAEGYGEKGLLKGYKEERQEIRSKTQEGSKTNIIRSAIEYNFKGQMTGYTELSAESSSEIVTLTERSNIVYDEYDRTLGYREIETETSNDADIEYVLSSTTDKSNVLYDSYGNERSYEKSETRDDAPNVNVVTNWSGVNNTLGMVTEEIITTEKYGGDDIDPRNTRDLNKTYLYDFLGRVSSYAGTIKDSSSPDKTNTINWLAGNYDGLGQVLDYTEKNTEYASDGTERGVQNISRSDIQYNAYGLIESYSDVIGDTRTPDVIRSINRTGMEYNSINKNTAFNEVTIVSDAVSSEYLYTVNESKSDIIYDSLGREYGYADTKIDSVNYDLTQTLLRTNTEYDTCGNVEGYAEEERCYGPELSNMDYVVSVERKNIRYNNNDQITRYEEKIQNSATPEKLSDIVWETEGYDNYGQLKGDTTQTTEYDEVGTLNKSSEKIRTNLSYNAAGQIISYAETTLNEADGKRTTTNWSGGYDGSGRVISESSILSIKDAVTEGTLYSEGETIIKTTSYNKLNQVTGVSETRISVDDDDPSLILTETFTRSAISYDSLGQMIGWIDESVRNTNDGKVNVTKKTVRDSTAYINGLVSEYVETCYDSNTPDKTTTITWNGEYNDLGQVSGYTQTNDDDGSLTSYDLSLTSSFSGIMYDILGRQNSYIETTVNNATPDLTQTATREETLYNDFGEVSEYREKAKYEGLSIVGNIGYEVGVNRTLIQYDSKGRMIAYNESETDSRCMDKITEKTWTVEDYDIADRITGYTESAVEKDILGGAVLNQEYRNTRSDIVYNNMLTTGYTDIYWSNASAGLEKETKWMGGYDRFGMLINENTEACTHDKATGGSLFSTAETTSKNIEYNFLAQAVGYTEGVTKMGTAPISLETIERSNIAYDLLGQVSGYSETVTEESEIPSLVYSIQTGTTRSDIKYDNNRIDEYKDTITTNSAKDKITTIEWSGEYNMLGQISEYSQNVGEMGTVPFSSNEHVYDVSYDTVGRQTGYTKDEIDSLASDKNVNTVKSGVLYNDFGLEYSWNELRTEADISGEGSTLNYTENVDRVSTTYTADGRVSGYEEIVTENSSPAKEVVRNWSLIMSDDLGRDTQDRTVTTTRYYDDNGSLEGELAVTDDKLNISYDQCGRLIGSKTINTNDFADDLIESVTLSGVGYNDYGEMIGYSELYESYNEDMSYYAKRNAARSDIQYNGQLITSYTETITNDSKCPDKTTTVNWSGSYNDLGQSSGYTEIKNEDDPLTSYLLLLTSTLSGVTYDIYGRDKEHTITYNDTSAPNKETVVHRELCEYNDAGQLNTYFETTTYSDTSPAGALSYYEVVERKETDYNILGAEIHYEESYLNSGELGKNIDRTWTADGWNSLGVLTSDTKETTTRYYDDANPSDIIDYTILETEIRTGIDYNQAGLLKQSTTDYSTSANMLAVRTKLENVLYNGIGLMSGYDQTVTEQSVSADVRYNKERVLERTEIEYDEKGRAKSYTENCSSDTSAPDKLVSIKWQAKEYNDLGQIGDYSITTTETSRAGADRMYERAITQEMENIIYDTAGRQICYLETVTDAKTHDLETVITRTATVYNSFGQSIGWEELRDYNMLNGNTALEYSENITRLGIAYDVSGNEIAYTEITDNRTDWAGVTITKDWQIAGDEDDLGRALGDTTVTTKTLGGEVVTSSENRSGFIFNSDGYMIECWSEKINGYSADLKEASHWMAAGYDDFGEVTGYTETKNMYSTDTAVLGANYQSYTETTRVNIGYDLTGALTGYNEEILSGTSAADCSLSTSVTMSFVGYDEFGRQDGYVRDETLMTVSGDYSVKTHTERQYTNYQNDNMSEYLEIETRDYSPVVTRHWMDGNYNLAGQLLAFSETETLASGAATTITRKEDFTVYNDYGLLTSYLDVYTSNIDDTIKTQRLLDVRYDESGRMEYYKMLSVDSYTPNTYVENMSGINENVLGQVTSYSIDLCVNGVSETKSFSDGVYDSVGDITSYSGAWISGLGAGEGFNVRIVEHTNNDPAVDALGRENKYTENETALAISKEEPLIFSERTVERNESAYNSFGKLTSYSQEETEGGIYTEINMSGIKYTANGETDSYYSEIVQEKGAKTIVSKTSRTDTTYDSNGRLSGYTEYNWSDTEGDLLNTISKTVASYDDYGREYHYAILNTAQSISEETESEIDSGVRSPAADTAVTAEYYKRTYSETLNVSYLPSGNMARSEEEITVTDGMGNTGITDRTVVYSDYNAKGTALNYSETLHIHTRSVQTTVTRDITTLDTYEQTVSYTDTEATSSLPGAEQSIDSTAVKTRTNNYTSGVLTGYSEAVSDENCSYVRNVTSVDESGNALLWTIMPVSGDVKREERKETTLDRFGREIYSYTTQNDDARTPNLTSYIGVKTDYYDGTDRVESNVSVVHTSGSYGENVINNTTVEYKYNFTYDSYGNATGYTTDTLEYEGINPEDADYITVGEYLSSASSCSFGTDLKNTISASSSILGIAQLNSTFDHFISEFVQFEDMEAQQILDLTLLYLGEHGVLNFEEVEDHPADYTLLQSNITSVINSYLATAKSVYENDKPDISSAEYIRSKISTLLEGSITGVYGTVADDGDFKETHTLTTNTYYTTNQLSGQTINKEIGSAEETTVKSSINYYETGKIAGYSQTFTETSGTDIAGAVTDTPSSGKTSTEIETGTESSGGTTKTYTTTTAFNEAGNITQWQKTETIGAVTDTTTRTYTGYDATGLPTGYLETVTSTAGEIVGANCRTTKYLSNVPEIMAMGSVSTKVVSDTPVVVERSMYWDEGGVEWNGGHSGTAVSELSEDWYFAEGCKYGTDNWLLLFNPNLSSATVDVTFYDNTGKTYTKSVTVGANCRATYNVNDSGSGFDLSRIGSDYSMKVHVTNSTVANRIEIAAERAMYWDSGDGGHCSAGASALRNTWYFAEGCTNGFDEWVALVNPDETNTANIAINYHQKDASGALVTTTKTYSIPPKSRYTINVNGEVPISGDVSMTVTSSIGIAAERSMYWDSQNGGTCSLGASDVSETWYMAEGCTHGDFTTYVLLYNPSGTDATVQLTYSDQEGNSISENVTVPAYSRYTRSVNNVATMNGKSSVSIKAHSTNGVGIVAERAVYWKSGGSTGWVDGHVSVAVSEENLSTTWYLAEGCVLGTFDTWLIIQNPNATNAHVDITYMSPSGNVLNSGSSAQTSTVSEMKYDWKGRPTDYTVSYSDTTGNTDHYHRKNIQYDELDNIIIYYQERESSASGWSRNTTILTYDEYGRVLSTTTKGISSQSGYTAETINYTYDEKGRIKTIDTTGWTSTSGSYESHRYDIKYNESGKITGFSETGKNNTLGEYSYIRTNIIYDNHDRMVTYTDTGTSQNQGAYALTYTALTFDMQNRVTSYREEGVNIQRGYYTDTTANITYDNAGRISSYIKTEIDTADTKIYTHTIGYDQLTGLINSITDTGISEAQGAFTSIVNDIQYDQFANKIAEHRIMIDYSGKTETFRTDIKYDADMRVESYRDEEKKDVGSGTWDETTTRMSDIKYDDKNRITSYTEETRFDGSSGVTLVGSPEVTQTGYEITKRSNITYDDKNRITGYTDEISETRDTSHESRVSMSNMTYNDRNQLTGFLQTVTKDGKTATTERSAIQYEKGKVTAYKDKISDTAGKEYLIERKDIKYNDKGLISSYKEIRTTDGKEMRTEVFNMEYNSLGQLISQMVSSSEDNFMFSGATKYTFSYDDKGNLSGTKVETPDSWATFDKDGNKTGEGLSDQMNRYIDWMRRKAEAEARARASRTSDEGRGTVTTKKDAQVNAVKDKMTKERGNSKTTSGNGKIAVGTSGQNARRGDYSSAKNNPHATATNKSSTINVSSKDLSAIRSTPSADPKTPSALIKGIMQSPRIEGSLVDKDLLKQSITAKIDADGFKTVETTLPDGNVKIMIQDTYTGNTTIIQLDKDSDVTARENITPEGVHSVELHNYTKDASGVIVADDYTKEIAIGKKGMNPTQPDVVDSSIKETGHLDFNSFGQVVSADITREIKSEALSSKFETNSKLQTQNNYTETIHISTTSDGNGLVSTQHTESTISQQITGSILTKETKTVTDRTNSYGSDGILTGWQETEKTYINDPLSTGKYEDNGFVDTGLTTERTMSDIAYNSVGQMSGYTLTEHKYGVMNSTSAVTLDGSAEVRSGMIGEIDVITVQKRYDMQYSPEGNLTSYKQDNWSSAAPDLQQHTEVAGIEYNSDGNMSSYTEYYSDNTGTSSITERSGMTYDLQNRLTGYTDNITHQDGSVSTVNMSNMTYHIDGKLNGYTQTSYDIYTSPDGTIAPINKSTTTINSIVYNSAGLIVSKVGTVNGSSYSYEAVTFDTLGRATCYKEEIGDTNYKHTKINYDTYGRVTSETIKLTAEQGGLIPSGKTVIVTDYTYGYDSNGVRSILSENEIYRKTTTSIVGTIIKSVVGIALTALTGIPALGITMLGQTAILAGANMLMSVMSGADLKDALLSAVITIGATVAGRIIGGAIAGGSVGIGNALTASATGLTPISLITDGLNLLNQVMVNSDGETLMHQLFGKNGDLIFGIAQTIGGFLAGGVGNKGDPEGLLSVRLTSAFLNIAITTGSYFLDGKIDSNLLQGIRTFLSSAVGAWSEITTEQIKIRSALGNTAPEGYIPTEKIKDANGTPVYTQLPDGRIISYDINGNIEGVLAKDAMPLWNDDGTLKGSYIETDEGVTFYDTQGSFEAYIPDGNEPMYNNTGRITSSYKDNNGTVTIYNEKGQIDSTITKETSTTTGNTIGYTIDDGKTFTCTDKNGITTYEINNNDPDKINFYDIQGSKIDGTLSSSNDKFIYTEAQTQQITLYDNKGDYIGKYNPYINGNGETTAYTGYDAQGNYQQIDLNFNPIYSTTHEGKYTQYDINPDNIQFIINPDTVHIIETGNNIRFVIGQDKETGTYKLYDGMGNKITDNPVAIAVQLNLNLLTMPKALAQDIIANAKAYMAVAYTEAHKNDYQLTQGEGLPLSARLNEIRDNISAWTWYITTDLSMQTLGTAGEIAAVPFQLLNIAYDSLNRGITNLTGHNLDEWNQRTVAVTINTPLPQDDIFSAITTGLNESLKGLPFVIGLLTSISRTEKIADKISDLKVIVSKTDDMGLVQKEQKLLTGPEETLLLTERVSKRISYTGDFQKEAKNFGEGYIIKDVVEEDLFIIQRNSDLPIGKGRSLKYWTTVEEYNKFNSMDEYLEKMALLDEWGDRSHVTVAKIPAGTSVKYAIGPTREQYGIAKPWNYRSGGGTQLLFEEFDPDWIIKSK